METALDLSFSLPSDTAVINLPPTADFTAAAAAGARRAAGSSIFSAFFMGGREGRSGETRREFKAPLPLSLSLSPVLPSTLSVLAHRAHGLTPRPTPTALLYFAKTPRTPPPLEGKFWKVRSLPRRPLCLSAMRRGARIDKTAHKRRRITLFALLEPSEGRSDDGRHRPRGNVGIGCVNRLCNRKWLCLK